MSHHTTHKLRLPLTWLLPPLLAAAIVAIGYLANGSGDATSLAICRELLAGTDQGRQALVGSCWHAPLTTLTLLPFTWLLGCSTIAALTTAWAVWTFTLVIAGRTSGRETPRGWMLIILLALGIVASGKGALPSAAVAAAATIFALRSAVLWWQSQGLRDLVKLAAALAGLTICGAPLAGVTLALALVVPLGALRNPDTCRRIPAIILLGWLPAIYTLAVWLLMNRLIFGSALFFVSNLHNEQVLLWSAATLQDWFPSHPAEALALAFAAYAYGMGSATRNTRAVAAGVLGILFWFWLATLRGASSVWADTGSQTALITAGALSLWLLRNAGPACCPPRVAYGDLAIYILIAWIGARIPAPLPTLPPADMIQQVEATALARSPHARVFVCGYSGLNLIPAATRQRLEPNLDLHVSALRDAWYGQNLFLLVPAPVGAAATENVHTRLPRLYDSGGGRLLFSQDYGPWRLFEIVGAPTARQLEEWRQTTP